MPYTYVEMHPIFSNQHLGKKKSKTFQTYAESLRVCKPYEKKTIGENSNFKNFTIIRKIRTQN